MADEVGRDVARRIGRRGFRASGVIASAALALTGAVVLVVSVKIAVTYEQYEGRVSGFGGFRDAATGIYIERQQYSQAEKAAIKQDREDDLNRSNRVDGGIGAGVSGVATVVGYRLTRRAWRQRNEPVGRVPTPVAVLCVAPLAAYALYAIGDSLDPLLGWLFD